MASSLSTSFSARLAPALITAALLGMTVLGARAQTDVSGTNTGAAGPQVSGAGTLDNSNPPDYFFGRYILNGDAGDNGYRAAGGTFTVHDSNFTGGAGGETTGTVDSNTPSPNNLPDNVNAGTGGAGLSVGLGLDSMGGFVNTVATVNSGTYTGGVGGTADGQANDILDGGYGGDGVNVNGNENGNTTPVTAILNGGTFQGGNSGPASGTAPTFNSGFGGSGLNVNSVADAVINGGSFTGGNGADVTERANSSGDAGGAAGYGVIVLADQNATVNIYGGTFTGGHSGALFAADGSVITPAAPGFDIGNYGGTTTLFGSGFTYTVTENGVTTTGTGPATFTQGANGDQPFGTITGLLQNNSAPTTITFQVVGGSLVLAPEPSQWAGLGIGMLGLAGLSWKARRRAA